MKPIVPLLCVTVGIAIGWFARPLASNSTGKSDAPSTSPTPTATAAIADTKSSSATETPVEKNSSGRPATPDNTGSKEKAREQMKEAGKKHQEQMAKRMLDIQRKKFEGRLEKLIADLNLTPDQQAEVRAAMEKRFETMGALFSFDPSTDADKLKNLTEVIKTDGLDEATANVLSDDQKKQYAEFKSKERQNRVEARALKDLGNITTTLELSAEQRDGVYQALADEAAKREDSNKSNGLMNMFTEGMGIQIDDELGLQDLMQEQMEAQMSSSKDGSNLGDIQKRMRETVKQRTQQRIDALRPHLNESQIKQYQAHMEAKSAGMLNMFGGGGDETEGGTN